MDLTKSLADALNTALPAMMDRMDSIEAKAAADVISLEAKLANDLAGAESRLLEALGPRLDTLNATLAGFLALAHGVVNGRFVPAETALK